MALTCLLDVGVDAVVPLLSQSAPAKMNASEVARGKLDLQPPLSHVLIGRL
jgi:hypothetical protein